MRFIQICWVLVRFLVFHPLTVHRRANFGRRLKLAFEELGLAFVKIGQILSMRYDLLSERDCESLQELLDRVRPVPLETIHAILEREYAKPYTAVFRQFWPEPLGSASVSQVHKAELFDGSLVAVKVKRQGIERAFLQDMKIMKRLARVAEALSPTLRHVQLCELVKYFESWLTQDLDFRSEVENMKAVKAQYAFAHTNFRPDLGRGIFPEPFEELCTENIVVMDYIDGVPLSRKAEIAANPAYDVKKSVRSYVNAAIRNWFLQDRESYLFQADPHLSNILVLPRGDAANIDYGLTAKLTHKEARLCKDLVIAVYMKNLPRALRISIDMTGVDYERYAPILKADIAAYIEKAHEERFGFWFLEFAKIFIRHKIKFPLFLTTFGRTNLMLDGLVNAYLPGETTLEIVGVELKREALKEVLRNVMDVDWLRVAYALSEKIKETPDIASELLNDPLGVISRITSAVKTAA